MKVHHNYNGAKRCNKKDVGGRLTAYASEVTCNQCIYKLVWDGPIFPSDPRVTASMLEHMAKRKRNAEANPLRAEEG